MVKRVPPESRSKQLQRYYDKVKPVKKPTTSRYNGGAERADLSQLSPFHRSLAVRLYNKRKDSRVLGVDFDLDIEWCCQQSPVCAVTGAKLEFEGKTGPNTVSFDQIIPRGGYTKANVRLVANWFNIAKRDWPDDQIQQLILTASDHIRAVKNEEK